jgi:hypothetical protein
MADVEAAELLRGIRNRVFYRPAPARVPGQVGATRLDGEPRRTGCQLGRRRCQRRKDRGALLEPYLIMTWGTYCCTRSLRLKQAHIYIRCIRSKRYVARNGYFLTAKEGGGILVSTTQQRVRRANW